MCEDCWEEYGKSIIENARTRRVLHLVKGVYHYHNAGGHLHVILDDWNIGDESIEWSVQRAPTWESDEYVSQKGINIERVCLKEFQKLSLEERNSVLAKYSRYF